MDQNADADPDKPNNIIRPYNTKELAGLYKVSTHTFRNWIKPFAHKIGKRIGYTYTVLQVSTILECLGPPPAPEK